MRLQQIYRLTTFIPPKHFDIVLDAITAQAPLIYGPYEHSAWWCAGTEQFRPLPGAVPTVGAVGETERLPTMRLEFAIPRETELLDRVLDALIAAHPWQEAAVFIDESTAKISHPASQ